MLDLYSPALQDLWFRKLMLMDEATMSYNHAWGGTIDFCEDRWEAWHDKWVKKPEGKRFYSYLVKSETGEFVGEAAYRFDGSVYLADVLIYAKYRGNGFGKEGLRLLCQTAKNAGIAELYDDIAIDNPAVSMFIKMGFEEKYRTSEIIMLKKTL